eukprot:GHVP01031921.1.p1 GENE.GHVP01031921.1~~GHVP01031921.1.p1  ORF type:complete len:107 (-),score=14.04 GHVP01031921.1:182-502(-)
MHPEIPSGLCSFYQNVLIWPFLLYMSRSGPRWRENYERGEYSYQEISKFHHKLKLQLESRLEQRLSSNAKNMTSIFLFFLRGLLFLHQTFFAFLCIFESDKQELIV